MPISERIPAVETITTTIALVAVITAHQEEIEWWLRCAASLVAFIAGCLAIYRFFRPRPAKRRILPD